VLHARDAEDHIFQAMARASCFYEIELLEYMYRIRDCFAGDGSIAVDVGANIGNHSVFFGAFLVPHVVSVEPNPAVLPLLEQNLTDNSVQFSIVPIAVSDRGGHASIVMPMGSTHNLGMAQVVPADPAGTAARIELATLDDVLAEWRRQHRPDARVVLLKVDVEGMELGVLKGASKTLATDRPHVFAEAMNRDRLRELREFLTPLGYVDLCRLAATPVYHFVHAPNLAMRQRARMLKLLAELRRPTETWRVLNLAFGRLLKVLRARRHSSP
jgi:FkbM family methyltransferase